MGSGTEVVDDDTLCPCVSQETTTLQELVLVCYLTVTKVEPEEERL